MTHPNSVTVLLALYNGMDHLTSQLQSYVNQTCPPTRVLASDDHPEDGTGDLFRNFAAQAPVTTKWDLILGPQQGLTANFLHLIAKVDPNESAFFALSDQDDIWLPEKLSSAVEILTAAGAHSKHPMLLGTRSWEWVAETGQRRLSRLVPEPLDFTHALVQNYAGGNTMVMNSAAVRLLQQALPNLPLPAAHDWWLYQVISGAGGTVLLDQEPRILYRQHSNNQVGANATFASKLKRFTQMLTGTYRQWMDQNLAALNSHKTLLTKQNIRLLERVTRDRDATLPHRLRLLTETRLHRKGRTNQVALWIAVAFRKM